jgi:phosphoenolpyruvate carboxylase
MGILTFEDLASDLGFEDPPVFEVILPMTDEAKKIIHLQKTFAQVARLKHKAFGQQREGFEYLRVIPLIEGISELTASLEILREYLRLHREEYGTEPEYLRPFIARSDPPLNAGLVPATVAAKIALWQYYRFGKESGIPVFPIIGVGSLPFRGGLAPDRVEAFLTEYSGVRTVTLQSAFRYDYPLSQVKEAIQTLNQRLVKGKPPDFSAGLLKHGISLSTLFSLFYRQTIESLTGMINDFSRFIPQRRERMLHIGLFGYARGIGGKRLPRAITFTACLYSLGIPPELIGTGRGLREAKRKGLLPSLHRFYHRLREDLQQAGAYLNRENLAFLARHHGVWRGVQEDVEAIEKVLGLELGPHQADHYLHRNLVSSVYLLWQEGREFSSQILEAAQIRRSIG